ncbi:hypothetical protein GQ42DRAFT_83520 [Ramicandelaber brevisporus]|nr:hypothetical protein GQ42DRAFT_83520 [Ramicandelaber brevisporus]
MISPNDIIFFLHHGMVDRLYYMWQLQSWTTRRSQYNGQTAQNQTVQATDVMPGLNSTAAEYFDPSSDSLCYTYDDLQTAQASTVAAVSALPRDALRDLFPTVAHNATTAARFAARRKASLRSDRAADTGQSADNLPAVPLASLAPVAPLDPEYARMMQMDMSEVARLQREADAVTAALSNLGATS